MEPGGIEFQRKPVSAQAIFSAVEPSGDNSVMLRSASCLFIGLVLLALAEAPRTSHSGPVPASFRDCPECPEMVPIPGGTFQMGDASAMAKPDEQPVHEVTVAAFAAGRFEVTRGEFAAFVTATGYAPSSGCLIDRTRTGQMLFDSSASWRDPGYPQTDRDPVVCMGWADAQAYAAWLSRRTGKVYRLLSEAEWEYAARAGTTSEFFWGNTDHDLCTYANGGDLAAQKQYPSWPAAPCNDGYVFTAPVGSFRPNAFGLYDMAGNAWEWIADCYAPRYDVQPRDGSAYTGGSCDHHVLRGGSWGWGTSDERSSQRNPLLPLPSTVRGGDFGFRLARAL